MPKFVKVTVSTTHPGPNPPPASITIAVDQDPIALSGLGHGHGAHVHWDLDTPGWTFAANGISVAAPAGKFSDRGRSNQNRRHTWQRDQPADEKRYKYTVTVTNGSITVDLDPFIINN
jgi:hypothetical protein